MTTKLRFLPDQPKRRVSHAPTGPLLLPPFAGLERHGYRCIMADPAWLHETWTPKGQSRRSPSHHYAVMSVSEIRQLPVEELAAEDCWLFLWTTWPHLEAALSVMKAWGFTYSSEAFTWLKLHRGREPDEEGHYSTRDIARATAYTTWKSTEPCLLGRRGKAKRISTRVNEIVVAPRREHSRKPDEVRRRVELFCEGPRLELFARERAPGWDAWGNELGKFSPPGDEAAELGESPAEED